MTTRNLPRTVCENTVGMKWHEYIDFRQDSPMRRCVLNDDTFRMLNVVHNLWYDIQNFTKLWSFTQNSKKFKCLSRILQNFVFFSEIRRTSKYFVKLCTLLKFAQKSIEFCRNLLYWQLLFTERNRESIDKPEMKKGVTYNEPENIMEQDMIKHSIPYVPLPLKVLNWFIASL